MQLDLPTGSLRTLIHQYSVGFTVRLAAASKNVTIVTYGQPQNYIIMFPYQKWIGLCIWVWDCPNLGKESLPGCRKHLGKGKNQSVHYHESALFSNICPLEEPIPLAVSSGFLECNSGRCLKPKHWQSYLERPEKVPHGSEQSCPTRGLWDMSSHVTTADRVETAFANEICINSRGAMVPSAILESDRSTVLMIWMQLLAQSRPSLKSSYSISLFIMRRQALKNICLGLGR